MAMILGKRGRENPMQVVEKRKASLYQPSRKVVQILSASWEANLSRLTVLFANMDPSALQRALSDTDNNLELSIQLLNRMRLDGAQESPAQHAQELVAAFQRVGSRDEAVRLAAGALQRYHYLACEQEERAGLQAAEALRQQLQVLSKDNEILKKAVVKLSSKVSEAEQKASENERLREELQRERMSNYALRLHLEQATSVRHREQNGPDVF
jgi:regulator of replication initiation timing